jgi:hypothetical protein
MIEILNHFFSGTIKSMLILKRIRRKYQIEKREAFKMDTLNEATKREKCSDCKKISKDLKNHPYNQQHKYCVGCWDFWFK